MLCVMRFIFNVFKKTIFIFFYLYIYPPDSQETTEALYIGRQLPRSAFGDAKVLLFACNLTEI